MQIITLKTTKRGLIGDFISRITILLLFACLGELWYVNLQRLYIKHDVSSLEQLSNCFLDTGEVFTAEIGMVVMCFLAIVAMIIIIEMLQNYLYGSKTIHVLRNEPGVGWVLKKLTVGFGNARKIETTQFNRITGTEMSQGMWDRRLNVGDLSLTLVTFTNGDSSEASFNIEGIEDPASRRDEIELLFRSHEGLLVELKQGPVNS